MKALFASREIILAAILILGVAAIGTYQPVFLEWQNISDLLTETSVLMMMALAQMVVILTRGIDLSVAANLALSGFIAALVSQYHPELPLFLMILAGIATGLLLGLINGALVAFLGIPPIVVTLGTLAVFRGMIIILAGGDQVNASEMGTAFQAFPKDVLLGLTSPVWIAIGVSILFWVFLNFTRPGRGLYASAAILSPPAIAASTRAGSSSWPMPSRARWRGCAAICGSRAMASPIQRSPTATS